MVQYGSIPTEHADRSYEEQLQVLALALFDNTAALHQLPAAARRLLQLAAACYAAARQAGAEHPDQVGRDAALAAPIDDLTPEQQCIVASVVAFQREQLHRSRELAYLRLDERDQQTTLRLTALLSLATILTADPRGDLLVWAD